MCEPTSTRANATNRDIPSRRFELRPIIHRDTRGFFIESYHLAKLADIGIADDFVQDNHSRSAKGTLRGLHYQLRHSQAKLCRVVEGEALDVTVDIGVGSPTFGQWTSVLLSAKQLNQVYIPTGFAHGYLALTDTVQFLRSLRQAELGPIKHGGAEIDHRGVQAQQRILETELPLLSGWLASNIWHFASSCSNTVRCSCQGRCSLA